MNKTVQKYLAAIGKKGGKKKSERKAAACRENGKKGGRPKKLPAPSGQETACGGAVVSTAPEKKSYNIGREDYEDS